MNILQINNYYYKRGGSETHFFDLIKLLEEKQHKVIVFSTKNKNTINNEFIKYFPKYNDLSKFNSLFGFFINLKAIKNLNKSLKENKIDIAHVHNIYHHLTPAILKTLKKNKIPIVMTLHDYKLICPNYSLFDFNKSVICKKCKDKNYFHCFKNNCIQNSKIKSFIATLEMYFQQRFFSYSKLVDKFIAPSQFIKDKFIEFNFPNKNIEVIHNFVENKISNELNIENYFLYFGRLSKEKGLKEFIEILSEFKSNFNFYIAGNGPEEYNLKNLVNKLNLQNKIKFLGFFDENKQSELENIIKKAQFIVVPSIWYENCSLSILEAMSMKKLVFASNIGGNNELIEDSKTGVLFNFNNKKETIDKLTKIIDNNGLIKEISHNAKEKIEKEFNSEIYYKKLIILYKKLLKSKL